MLALFSFNPRLVQGVPGDLRLELHLRWQLVCCSISFKRFSIRTYDKRNCSRRKAKF